MASRLDLGAALCGQNPRPGDVPLRDGVDPLRLADGLLNAGFSLDTTEKLLMAYYTRRSEVDESKAVVEELSSSASSGSTRSKRSEEFFRKCDLWLDKPGYCYTAIVRPSQRLRAASLCGQDATMADLFKLSKTDIAWQRLPEVRVQRVDNWSVHLSFERGSETFVSHMAAFAADFPTMVPQYWREYLSAMIPVQESWFGVTTRFGASPPQIASDATVQDVFAVEQVLYRGCGDTDTFESLFDLEFVCVEPTRVTVPVGARLLDLDAGVIASASKCPVEVLLIGDSRVYVEGAGASELRARPADMGDSAWEEMLRDAAVIYDKSSDIGDPASFSLVSRSLGDGREYDVRTHCTNRNAAVLNEVYSVADRLGYDRVAVESFRGIVSSSILPLDVARMLRVDTVSKIEHSVFDGTGICTFDYAGVVVIRHDRYLQMASRQFPLARIYSLEQTQGMLFDHAVLVLYDACVWSKSELKAAFSRHRISLHLSGLRRDMGLYAYMSEHGFELPDFS